MRRQLIHPGYNFLRPAYWFGQADSRPLSLFRIAFGALLLKNALYSIALAQLLYSDEGIVPRPQFWDDPTQAGLGQFSLLNYLSATWMAVLFFAGWSVISLALLLGYRTRLMAVLNYLCKLSVLHRNPFPLSGADHVITVLSFWLIFLPLDHHYAVAGGRARRQGQARPPATTYAFPLRVIQLQVMIIYIFTSYMKWRGAFWREGEALYYTFQQNGYLLPAGIWLGQSAPLWLLRGLTWATLLIEAGFALLVFLPVLQPWARASGLLLTAALHLGIALTMSIPDFSVVMWISYLLFFEPSWVLWLEHQVRRVRNYLPQPRTALQPGEGFGARCVIVSPAAGDGLARGPRCARLGTVLGRVIVTLVLTVALVTTVWGGLEEGRRLSARLAPPMPAFLKAIEHQLNLASDWKMFVYLVIPRAGWLMVQGQWENGATTLLYSGADPTTGRMYRLWGPGARLRLLEQHLLNAFPTPILRAWGSYYCRLFNRTEQRPVGQRLARLEIHLRYRWSHAPGAPPNPYEDDLLWRHQCFSP